MKKIKRNKSRRNQGRGMAAKPGGEALKKDIGQFVNNAIGIMYHEVEYPKNVKLLKDESISPMLRVSNIAVPIAQRVTDIARKRGVQPGLETLAQSGPIIVRELLLIAEKEKAFEMDNDEIQATIAYTSQEYMRKQIKRGIYDPKKLQQEMLDAIKDLTPEQKIALDREGEAVQAGVDKHIKKYSKNEQPPPNGGIVAGAKGGPM